MASPFVAPTAEIRAHFPARIHSGLPVAYFDGPGGTQVPNGVVEAMADYLYHHNANTHWEYPTSNETDAAIEYARAALADFLNASPAEIVFGANMTTLAFISPALSGAGSRRAMRSSSRNWITTPTLRHGRHSKRARDCAAHSQYDT
jgi:selenocysteine lyase/cysteine desulfurase